VQYNTGYEALTAVLIKIQVPW